VGWLPTTKNVLFTEATKDKKKTVKAEGYAGNRKIESERQLVIDGLLRYCELDTRAMVMLWMY
jgi:hypothetical protein